MTEQEFWDIIAMLDWSETGDDNSVMKNAVEYLSRKTHEEISAFYNILTKLLYDIDGIAWARNMGDAPIVDGDPYYSPDRFLYARCCVVANGENFYYDVRKNPDLMPRDMEFESLLYLAELAWKRGHENDPDYEDFFCDTDYDYESFSNEAQW